MNRQTQIELIEKAIEGIRAGRPFHERRDIFPKNEQWSSAEQMLRGRLEDYMLPLMEAVTGCTHYDLKVDGGEVGFVCYWESGAIAGECEVPRTHRHFDDIGRAALGAILCALAADLRDPKEPVPLYGGAL